MTIPSQFDPFRIRIPSQISPICYGPVVKLQLKLLARGVPVVSVAPVVMVAVKVVKD